MSKTIKVEINNCGECPWYDFHTSECEKYDVRPSIHTFINCEWKDQLVRVVDDNPNELEHTI